MEVAHPTMLIDDRTVKVPHLNGKGAYMVLDIERNDDVVLTFSSTTSATGVLGTLYIMPYMPVFTEDIAASGIEPI